jgi:hypothetical protein
MSPDIVWHHRWQMGENPNYFNSYGSATTRQESHWQFPEAVSGQ